MLAMDRVVVVNMARIAFRSCARRSRLERQKWPDESS